MVMAEEAHESSWGTPWQAASHSQLKLRMLRHTAAAALQPARLKNQKEGQLLAGVCAHDLVMTTALDAAVVVWWVFSLQPMPVLFKVQGFSYKCDQSAKSMTQNDHPPCPWSLGPAVP